METIKADFLVLKEKSVLFAEDVINAKTEISNLLKILFKTVYNAKNGEEALILYEEKAPDIIISNVIMPKMTGLNLVKKIRMNDYETPVILLSNHEEKEYLLDATNLSVDGYLIKPIDLEKFTQSICRAMQRLYKTPEIVSLEKNLIYNSATKELYQNGNLVTLGSKERKLLSILIANRHRTLTKEEIEKALWGFDPISDSALKKLILRIRQKMRINIIVPVRGVGYRLEIKSNF
jgi:two-component system, OmpR family, response regulator VanR